MRALQVIVWFFLLLSSGFGVILSLFGLSQVQTPGPGPGAPLEGVAVVMGLGILAGSLLVLVLCLCFRPPRAAFTSRNWVMAAGCYALFVLSVFSLTRSARYTLTARVLDSSGKPVPEASVRFSSFALGEGWGRFDRRAEGRIVTDAAGSVTIRTSHAHRIDLDIQKEGFQRMSVQLEAAGRRYPHQVTSPARGAGIVVLRPTSARFDKQSGLLIPPEGDIMLDVTLQKL